MRLWLRDWWLELTDPATYRRWGLGPFWAGFWAGWFRSMPVRVPVVAAILAVAWLNACSPSAFNTALATTTALLEAGAQVHEAAERLHEARDAAEAAQIAEHELPAALEQLDRALATACDPKQPLLQADSKVCRHYRAYKADPEE